MRLYYDDDILSLHRLSIDFFPIYNKNFSLLERKIELFLCALGVIHTQSITGTFTLCLNISFKLSEFKKGVFKVYGLCEQKECLFKN